MNGTNNGNARLSDALREATTVSPEALVAHLRAAEQIVHAYSLRIAAAEAVGDASRVKQLQEDPAHAGARKRAEYFRGELGRAFPKFVIPGFDFADVERAVVVNDYLDAARLKRDAEITSKAARALDEKEARRAALAECERALKYLKFYERPFRKFQKEIERSSASSGGTQPANSKTRTGTP